MSNRLVAILLVLSLAFNLAVAASLGWIWATRDRGPGIDAPPHEALDPCGPACRVLSRRMGLRGERAELVHRIMGESADRTRELRIEIGTKRRRLAGLLTSDAADSAEIMQTVDEISSLQGELEKTIVERLMNVRAVLDEDEMRHLHRMIGGPAAGSRRSPGHPGHRRHSETGGQP